MPPSPKNPDFCSCCPYGTSHTDQPSSHDSETKADDNGKTDTAMPSPPEAALLAQLPLQFQYPSPERCENHRDNSPKASAAAHTWAVEADQPTFPTVPMEGKAQLPATEAFGPYHSDRPRKRPRHEEAFDTRPSPEANTGGCNTADAYPIPCIQAFQDELALVIKRHTGSPSKVDITCTAGDESNGHMIKLGFLC
ncbi:hypothetical protein NQ176_g8699 [Zarea fungicola]|uniref:Uncharacterized protein n=1 Tax=Zarea fungicola TaxID=93591 RepID=A0ACC1MSY7_9HYPO|nr:hypothetical protein NQ176_g8699 [Lecanicillium fungicola]